jgi:hypothetical protein
VFFLVMKLITHRYQNSYVFLTTALFTCQFRQYLPSLNYIVTNI